MTGRVVKSKSLSGLQGVAHEVEEGFTWVTFYEGRTGLWLPNEDLTDVDEIKEFIETEMNKAVSIKDPKGILSIGEKGLETS
jgi:hypothetical protein